MERKKRVLPRELIPYSPHARSVIARAVREQLNLICTSSRLDAYRFFSVPRDQAVVKMIDDQRTMILRLSAGFFRLKHARKRRRRKKKIIPPDTL